MPAHFDTWCEALATYGADRIFKEDVFFAMGGRPTRDIVVDLNSEQGLIFSLGPQNFSALRREGAWCLRTRLRE